MPMAQTAAQCLQTITVKEYNMPVHRTPKGKWKWGTSGKEYPTKKQAERQARAIYASGYKPKKKGK